MFLGIDIGTTAIKFAVIADGKIKFQQTSPVTTYRKQHMNYQRATELLEVLKVGIQSIPKDMREALETISFSVAMHSILPWGEGLDDAIYIWSDTQAEQTIAAFKQQAVASVFYQRTGTPIHPMSPFAKLLYFQQHARFPEQTHYYGIKELVMHYFTGEFVIDYATASATGLFNLLERTWDDEILAFIGISKQQLAPLVDTTATFSLESSAATELKIPATITVVIGASDGCLAAYASYIATDISNSLTIGTSASVRKVTTQPTFDNTNQNFCYYLNEKYYVTGAPSNNGGCVLEWASQLYADTPTEFFENLPNALKQSPIGANGLCFEPFINGERAPLWQADVTGTLKNIRIQHTKADMIRSVVEGILFNIRTLTETVNVTDNLSLSGGFFKSEILREMTADILGVDCYLSDYNEPIMGLYYLIYGRQTTPASVETMALSLENHEQYTEVFKNYFSK